METRTVCLDGFNLAMPKGSGIATYARNLNHTLRAIGVNTQILYGPEQAAGDDPLLDEISLFDAPPPPTPMRWVSAAWRDFQSLGSPFGRRAVPVGLSGALITRQVAQNAPSCDGMWAARNLFHAANRAYGTLGKFTSVKFGKGSQEHPDVVHWTCPLPMRVPGIPNVYTIHDLVPLRLPFATLDNKRRFLSMCREICATADKLVTVSQRSKEDIVSILGVDEARIAVTYQSVELPAAMVSRPDEDVAREIAGVFGLDWRGYFIFFGAIEPKKNLGRVIEAYLAAGVEAPLVVIGGKAWLDDEQTRMLYEDLVEVSTLDGRFIRRADRVRVYDYMPFAMLVSLIRGAKATLLPSLYEGFGLPVLESMMLRTPVLSSTEGSLPEVAGDAALLVDPYDSQAIRKGIQALDADADLRAGLIERGLRRSARFSPEAYQCRLTELYRPLV